MPNPKDHLTVIVPANNEEDYIQECLDAVLAQQGLDVGLTVIVAANACTDKTVPICKAMEPAFREKEWRLDVLDIAEPGKVNALNSAEKDLPAGPRVYLDADVLIEERLLDQLADVLLNNTPLYATGTLQVKQPRSFITKRYAGCWQRLPFVKSGAVGAGLFAVNAAGRARWGAFPKIISDDTFVRLNFSPAERKEVPAAYVWPMIEGFSNLVRVRRRQDAGVTEIYEKWPELRKNEGKATLGSMGHLRLLIANPLDYLVYSFVQLTVKLGKSSSEWTRGR